MEQTNLLRLHPLLRSPELYLDDGSYQIFVFAILALLLVMFLGPPLLLGVLYLKDRGQKQHAVLRNYPILGRLRYLLEHVGPELRQYLFDADLEGKPFTREGYRTIVFAGKYMKTLISFGSKRDFEEPGCTGFGA